MTVRVDLMYCWAVGTNIVVCALSQPQLIVLLFGTACAYELYYQHLLGATVHQPLLCGPATAAS